MARFQNSLLEVSRISNILHTGVLIVIQVFFLIPQNTRMSREMLLS